MLNFSILLHWFKFSSCSSHYKCEEQEENEAISNKGNLKLFEIVASRRHTTQLWQKYISFSFSVCVYVITVKP
jgi:hypothetical protein